MADKARDAFRTISEVANWLDVPAHVLRFWESKFPQIKPVKRAGGRRYYRPADMQLIGGIKKLLHDDGLTIRGVQKMLKEDGIKGVSEMSPALEMPSDEEGAARREARRARRQARQDARQTDEVGLSAPSELPETEREAPFIHIEDSPTAEDNVVSISADRPIASLDATDEPDDMPAPIEEPDVSSNAPVSETPTPEDLAAMDAETREVSTEIAEEPEPYTAPVEPEEPIASDEPAYQEQAAQPEQASDASMEDTDLQSEFAMDTPLKDPIEEPEAAHDAPLEAEPEPVADLQPDVEPEPRAEPVAEPEPEPSPPVDVPADPDPAEIALTSEQVAFAHRLKLLRRGGSDEASSQTALAKLTGLRTRMLSRLG